MTTVFGVALIGLLFWVWLNTMRAREIATGVCTITCRKMGLQFLDGTVALHRMAFSRTNEGRPALRRTYRFEYSDDSALRHAGYISLNGIELTNFVIEDEEGRQILQ